MNYCSSLSPSHHKVEVKLLILSRSPPHHPPPLPPSPPQPPHNHPCRCHYILIVLVIVFVNFSVSDFSYSCCKIVTINVTVIFMSSSYS